MERRGNYSFIVTKTVDKIVAPTFNTAAVAYLAATSPEELFTSSHTTNAFIVLERMKCVERVKTGGAWESSIWQVAFSPGPKCEGCHFAKKRNHSGCYRLENSTFSPEY